MCWSPFHNSDLKQTTTATATRTWKNKRYNEQNNSVRLYISEPSYTKQQREITKTATANYFNFHLELNASFIRYGEVKVWRRMRR